MLSHRKRERKFFLAAHTFVVVHRHTLHLSEECIKQAILDCYARRYEKFVLVILVATVNAFSWPWAFRYEPLTTTADGVKGEAIGLLKSYFIK